MKSLKKLSIDQMRIDFKVLTPSQSQEFVGGGNPIKIGGGFLEVTEIDGVKGTIYKGNDGSTYFFEGVNVGSGGGPTVGGTACQIGGTIYVGDNPNSFDINDMVHEYGHFLQEEAMRGKAACIGGTLGYAYVGIKGGMVGAYLGYMYGYALYCGGFSAYGYVCNMSDEDYYNLPSEKSANEYGNEYMRNKYGKDAPQATE